MTEQTYADTVDGVNEYLDGLKAADDQDAYQDERERILGLEQDKGDDGRKGILEGPHGFDGGEPGEAPQTAQEAGVLHDASLVEPSTLPTVSEAAPDDLDEDPNSSVTVPNDSEYEVNPPRTMQEQEAPSLEGEAYRKGYYGDVAADRVQTNTEAVAAVPSKDEE